MNLKEIREKYSVIKKRAEKGFASPFELEPINLALERIILITGYSDEVLEIEDDIQELRVNLYER